jgi:hypothetical protein
MTERAGVRAHNVKVRPGDAELIRITGARVPSGEPVPEREIPARRPKAPRTSGGYKGGGNRKFGNDRGKFDRDRGTKRDAGHGAAHGGSRPFRGKRDGGRTPSRRVAAE